MGDHPVKVPAELFAEWRNDAAGTQWMDSRTIAAKVADRAAQWGYDLREPELQQAADQELEACCEWVSGYCPRWPDGTKPEAKLRAARRPKPPSLKQQALAALEPIERSAAAPVPTNKESLLLIRRALEALDA